MTQLLHNMSAVCNSTIVHSASSAQNVCRAVVVSLPAWVEGALEPVHALRLLGVEDRKLTAGSARKLLLRRIASCASALPLPPAAVVTAGGNPDGSGGLGLLEAITILSKSSDTLYLRDKEPNLSGVRGGRVLTLHIPPSWRSAS
jgi:hypothetical protein